MIYFNKFFKLPGPVDLGMSDHNNAMASEFFRNRPDEFTWEMYYDRVQELYPVRFFLASTLPEFFRRCWYRSVQGPVDLIYWLKCHLLPSYKYHLVDTRKADPSYTHGWIDTDQRMVLAMFTLLIEFVELEMPHGYFFPSEEDAAKDDGTWECGVGGYRAQRDQYLEFMAIYNYWKVERPELEDQHNNLTSLWSKAREKSMGPQGEETERLWKEVQESKDKMDKRLEEMLHRLIDIRKVLWT